MYNVEIREIDEMSLSGFPHEGSYMDIGGKFEQAMGINIAQGHIQGPPQMVGIYYDDPGSVDVEKLRSFAGIAIDSNANVGEPLEIRKVKNGSYAVLTHKGPYGELSKAYTWFYGTWASENGKEFEDAPPFEVYVNSPHDTAPGDLLTEIHVPLKN